MYQERLALLDEDEMMRDQLTQQRALGLSRSHIRSVCRLLGGADPLTRLSDYIRKSVVLIREPGQACEDGVGEELSACADEAEQCELREGRLVRPLEAPVRCDQT